MLRCLKCSHEWEPRKPHPKRCPQCKSTAWMLPPGKGHATHSSGGSNINLPWTPQLDLELIARKADVMREELKALQDEVERLKKIFSGSSS